jgi:ABC-2 type transport system permease protein
VFRLYLKSIYEKKWLFLSLLLFAIFFIWMFASIYKTIAISSITEIVKIMPEKLIKSLNIEVGSMNTFEGFIGNEKHTIVITLLTTILGISLASGYLSGEIGKGTIYLPLSLPIKRASFYLTKLLAGMTVMVTFSALSILSTFPLTALYDIPIHSDRFLSLTLACVLFGLSVFGFSMFLSSVFSEKNNVAFIAGGVLILMYVMNMVANIKESLDFLKYYSVFHYFNIVEILVHNNIAGSTWLVFTGSFLLFSSLGLFIFFQRDINFS